MYISNSDSSELQALIYTYLLASSSGRQEFYPHEHAWYWTLDFHLCHHPKRVSNQIVSISVHWTHPASWPTKKPRRFALIHYYPSHQIYNKSYVFNSVTHSKSVPTCGMILVQLHNVWPKPLHRHQTEPHSITSSSQGRYSWKSQIKTQQ